MGVLVIIYPADCPIQQSVTFPLVVTVKMRINPFRPFKHSFSLIVMFLIGLFDICTHRAVFGFV